MKKAKLAMVIGCASLFISGCVDIYDHPNGYYDYDYYDKYGHHLSPSMYPEPVTSMKEPGKPRGHKPRPYSVTPQDQEKYDSLNNRIKNRAKAVSTDASKATTDTTNTTTTTAASTDATKADSTNTKSTSAENSDSKKS